MGRTKGPGAGHPVSGNTVLWRKGDPRRDGDARLGRSHRPPARPEVHRPCESPAALCIEPGTGLPLGLVEGSSRLALPCVPSFSDYEDMVEVVNLRQAVGPYAWRLAPMLGSDGKALSERMTLLLSLVVYGGYELFPGKMGILEKARVVGTYNADNRAAQYTTPEPRELLRAVNEAWTKIRVLEKELLKRDSAIAALREKLRRSQFVNVTLTSIITALAFRGLEFLFQAMR